MDLHLIGIMILLLPCKISTQDDNAQVNVIQRYERLVKSRYVLCQEELPFVRTRDRVERDMNPPCCGYCSLESDCYRYRTCCIDMFDTLEEAQLSMTDRGYECIYPQYLSGNLTKYTLAYTVWLVPKCVSGIGDEALVSLCENNLVSDNVEDIVPVTDLYTKIHYKSIHCARCNLKDDIHALATWNIQIYDDVFIKFPEKDLLAKIRSRKGNIFFIPTDYVIPDVCTMPAFTVSKCNVSGLWAAYDEDIEQGCNLFIDPFNSTYKNPFCYICDIPLYDVSKTPDTCSDTIYSDEFYEEPRAQFQTIVDSVTATQDSSGRKDEKNNVVCGQAEFKDENQMLCRRVMCHPSRELRKGLCALYTPDTGSCLNIAFKLTAYDQNTTELDVHFGIQIRDAVETLLDFHIPGIKEEIMSFQMYHVSHERDDINILVNILVNQCPWTFACLAIDQLLNVHKAAFTVILSKNDTFMYTWAELTRAINDQQDETKSFTKFYESVPLPILNNRCIDKEVVNFKKTNICPYIEIDKADMIGMMRSFDTGMHNDNQSGIIGLESWEYEDMGSQWRICFDDFITHYAWYGRQGTNPKIEQVGLPASGVCLCDIVGVYFVTISSLNLVICLNIS